MSWDDLPPSAEELGTSSSASSASSANMDWTSAAPTDEELGIVQAPGQLEALVRGITQGASMGFSDEATGLGESAIQSLLESLKLREDDKLSFGDKYTQERDESRTNNLAAQGANPWTYGAGNLAGAVGTGLASGGAGLLAKVAAPKLGAAAVSGSVRGLMALGAAEGAVAGLGASEADLTEGDLKGAAIDTAIGAGIGAGTAGLIKGGQKLYQGAKAVGKATPILGDVGTHLSEVAEEGSKNLGKSFKEAASESLDDLSRSADDIKIQGLAQESQYGDDLLRAKQGASTALDDSSAKVRENLHQTMNQIGEDLKAQDLKINDQIHSVGGLNNEIRLGPKGNIVIGKFDFDTVLPKFDAIAEQLEKPRAGLKNIKQELQSGDYLTVADKIRDLNDMISQASPYDRKLLGGLKSEIQEIVDENLKNLPGEAGKLYEARRAIAKNYSLLADVRDGLAARPADGNSQLGTNLSLISNKENLLGKDLGRELQKTRIAGDQPLNVAADEALQSAEQYNKFNVFNPEKGKMGLGENEILSQQFDQVFGKPKEFGVSSSLAKTLEELEGQSSGLTSTSKKNELLDWIRKTYGDKADDMIAELKAKSGKFKTMEAGLEDNSYAGQDVSSWIRIMKKGADPLAFMAGKTGQNISNLAEATGTTGLGKAATTLRALTLPQNYKSTVEAFKQSQQNNEVVPENK